MPFEYAVACGSARAQAAELSPRFISSCNHPVAMRSSTSLSPSGALRLVPILLAFGRLVIAQTVNVTLDDGAYFGSSTDGVNSFLGLRFGAPPVRFAPPAPAAKHSGILNATVFGPSCIQAIPAALAAAAPVPVDNQSEDCLFLNVYAPSTPAPAEGRAVMLWIFGGGFQLGTAMTTDFDGSSFAKNQDVIIVTPNYRTSVFGFPGAVEGIPTPLRNVGLFDQKLAVAWVQRNIHSFGGDPAKVTIFGESAGATSVDMLLLTSGPNPPFRAAITESGTSYLVTGPQAGGDLIGLVTGEGAGNTTDPFATLAAALGCPTTTVASLACVGNAPVDSIVAVLENNTLNFSPVADGDVNVPTSPDATRASGRVPKIPLLLGTNLDEAVVFTLARPNTTVAVFLEQTFPDNTTLQQQVAAAYPVGEGQPFATDADAITQIATDLDFACATSHEARLSAAAGIPTWRYLFNSTSWPTVGLGAIGLPVHASEIQFVFGLPPAPLSPDQALALSSYMQTAWANFAKDPASGPGDPQWAPFTGDSGIPDLGDLGGINGSGVVLVDPNVIDSRCYLYDAAYAVGLPPATPA
ncbi:Carboxylesterase [Xylariales sp. PMI_506]|nr:Carboxylesterase [Xylariales sp. PMI_506]